MLHKVSIGQDRNKKDPHRGRKLYLINVQLIKLIHDRNKKEPHRGRKWIMVIRGHQLNLLINKPIEE